MLFSGLNSACVFILLTIIYLFYITPSPLFQPNLLLTSVI
jgi:hypothetical protein